MSVTATRTHKHVLATELRAGDEIREPGMIPRRVQTVRVYKAQGWVGVDYLCCAEDHRDGYPGSATYALTTRVYIARTEEEGH